MIGVLLALTLATAPDGARVFSPLDTSDLEEASVRLRRHVAYLQSKLPTLQGQPLLGGDVDGWALVIGPRVLVCQAFLVKDAISVKVTGPLGQLKARILTLDMDVRVARLEASEDLTSIGLVAAPASPETAREVGMDVFALVSTRPEAGVVAGVVTEVDDDWLQGHVRSDLRLRRGMPVFDAQLRWLGLARAVDWDKDPALLIPPELVATATNSQAQPRRRRDEASERPWWAR